MILDECPEHPKGPAAVLDEFLFLFCFFQLGNQGQLQSSLQIESSHQEESGKCQGLWTLLVVFPPYSQ